MIKHVSIIIPTYNHGWVLRDAIDSALAQSLTDCEILVIDDGSTDDTQCLIADYLNYPCVRYYRQSHRGLGASRNRGLDLATGSYVQFLDADDLLFADKIELQLNALKRLPNVGAIHCDFQCVDGWSGKIIEKYGSPKLIGKSLLQNLILRWERGFSIPCHCFLFRREAIENLKFSCDLPNHEDWDFYIRWAAEGGATSYLSEELCAYRIFGDSLSRNDQLMDEGKRIVLARAASHSKVCHRLVITRTDLDFEHSSDR